MNRNPIISENETEILGEWVMVNDRVEADENCLRIDDLISTQLEKLGTDLTGWDTLFRDPADGRLWERIYRMGERHGRRATSPNKPFRRYC